MHLRYSMYTAHSSYGIKKHPQETMKDLGITYQHATTQSIADQWWFWNCENVPTDLPKYLEVLPIDPMEMVGWGLDAQTAELIQLRERELQGANTESGS